MLLVPRIFLNFKNQYFLTHVEGAWLACAYDFLHGVFYRPLFGPLGYGGTRYFPLYFVLTGWLSKPLGSLETAGIARLRRLRRPDADRGVRSFAPHECKRGC